MAQRLSERFPIGSQVEVYFAQLDHWFPGLVIRHEHPGVWVQTAVGQTWFVTNGRRIRPWQANKPADAE